MYYKNSAKRRGYFNRRRISGSTIMASDNPIGLFDSGLGGLSVLHEFYRQMPNENYVYVGDSGRNPYGPKGAAIVTQFTLEAAEFMIKAGVKAIVIACNTATVAALGATRRAYPDIPVIGVVEPGCIAAAEATRNGHIALVATKGTVDSGRHAERINELRPGTKVSGVAAPIFVVLAEEGWLEGPAPDAVAARYLADLFDGPESTRPDCLIFGCTHFPPLRDSIRKAVGDKTVLVNPAEITLKQTREALVERNLLRQETDKGKTRFCVTADPERFARVGSLFLNMPLAVDDIEVIALG